MVEVFIKDEKVVWVKARTEGKKENGIVSCVVNVTGQERKVKSAEYKGFDLPKQNNIVVDDLTDLKYLHEAAILYNLKERYETKELPYTRSGDLIISINPFYWIPHLYSETVRRRYAQKLVWETSNHDPRTELAPHVFEVCNCFRPLGYFQTQSSDSSVLPWHTQN